MTKKEELQKLHKISYISIILKSIEDRSTEENKFMSWYEDNHKDSTRKIKHRLKERCMII